MKQHLKIVPIFCIILTLAGYGAKAEVVGGDTETLRKQLFEDIIETKKNVDKLQISIEVVNERYTSQIDMLTKLHDKLINTGNDQMSDELDSYFNATFRKYNKFENQLITKIDEIQDDQILRLDQIVVKQNKNCGSSSAGSGDSFEILTTISSALDNANDKIDQFKEQLEKFGNMEEQLNFQQTKMIENQKEHLKLIQEISEKLTKNQENLIKFENYLPKLKNLSVNNVVCKKQNSLPMEVILGITNENMTKKN